MTTVAVALTAYAALVALILAFMAWATRDEEDDDV
jgi:hypothetical protein